MLISVAAVLVLTLSGSGVEIDGTVFLPDDAVLSDSAFVVMEADSGWSVTIESTGEDSMIRVRSSEMGECDFAIQDGDSTLAYTVRVYEDASGHMQIRLEAR